ncbi:MAG: hypothetical protein DWQ36_06080 [Acidobacteria bacterium]|nr:MAG: hypothetical protein DWQ30_19085 [Acidobacteriota bacterium]REK09616.1 MAG: hypothetical protein DWQ36_06080 [Acidobacteriota bacterium]
MGTIRVRDSGVTNAVFHVVFAAIVGGIGGWVLWVGYPFTLDVDSPDFNPLILVPALFLPFAGWQLISGLRYANHARRFGATVLELDSALRPGRTLVGRVDTRHTFSSEDAIAFELQCTDRYKTQFDDSVRDREVVEVVCSESGHIRLAESRTTLPIRVEVPQSGYSRYDSRKRGDVQWVLEVSAPKLGFKAAFDIPVES